MGAQRALSIAMIAACPFPYPRGTPVRIHRMSSAMARRGHDVHVFTYHLGGELGNDGVTVHRIPRIVTYNKTSPGPSVQKLLLVDPLLVLKLFKSLGRGAFDVVHAHHYEGLLVAKLARAGRRIPLIYDAHTLLGSELPYYRLPLPRSAVTGVGERLDRWLPGMSDHVVSVTQTIKDKLVASGFSENSVTVITNGVEHELFAAAASVRPSSQSASLVFTGNLASYQGVDRLLCAFAKVLERRKDARLLLVTESSFEPYERLAAQLGIRAAIELRPAPFVEHPDLLAAAAIAVNPRVECDGIPQKLLNYMAAGRPTVSFHGSAPCIEHARTGWVVANGDVDAFAAGIVKLLEEPELAIRLGRAARAAVMAEYTWDATARKSEALYRQLLGEHVAARQLS